MNYIKGTPITNFDIITVPITGSVTLRNEPSVFVRSTYEMYQYRVALVNLIVNPTIYIRVLKSVTNPKSPKR